ncbi:cytochrome P450 [Haloechinothrix sp. YIM 98757]|uniref:Cytochrome P450 n=1 Tax=Haloechinothrix aidingensis TaxID=2752311 RepID=A0A838AFJ1_9PSEU|nr:cytochrome P450 [Haloechinothrix aidingensis]MBA0127888.1 cytochrome P450 [Haloechinothrix aidingensis]
MTGVTSKVQAAARSVSERVPSRVRPLAEPPSGSGLKPVPGDYGLPLIGHSISALTDMLGFFRRRYARFGPVQWIGLLGTKVVAVNGPEALERVAINRDKAFANEGFYEYLIGPFFHRGIMLMDFDEHRHHRRIMQQAFTKDRLVGYLGAMNPSIERGVSNWQPDDRFPIYTAAKQLTLDIATDVFVGDDVGADADRINKAFVDAVHGGHAVVRANLPGGTWARGLRGRRVLEEYFRRQLPAKRAGDGDDLFSVLCRAESEDGERYSDEDIVNHMIFVLMAAHDTSTITLAMMAYYLGRYPEWQERARAESQELGKPALDYEDLDRLPALDMVFAEAMRINAPVGGLFREAVADTELLGHYIPAGTKVVAGIYPTQRMEEWWPDPDTFDPERFAEHRREDKVHRYAWAPFGGGVHKCIGMHFGSMEVKAIMHQMLLRFRWSVPAGYEPPMRYGTGPTPTDGLPIRLEPLPHPAVPR